MATGPVVDEETPLLESEPKPQTPFPWSQFSIVFLLQITEPLTSHVIHPFAPQLVRDSGVTNGNESQVGFYVGALHSVFYLAEAITVLYWSRLSDSFGRKPIILCGLFGLSFTMYFFGLGTTFRSFMISRALMGALNGNVGVIKSIIAELTDSTNISKAYAWLPLSWSTGIAVGPLIGGMLSHPADTFPAIFGDNIFLKKYPYFLACAVPASLTALAWIIAFQFLIETNPTNATVNQIDYSCPSQEQPPLSSVLTYDVLVTSANYASVALIDISFRCVLPVFLSTPIALGGLGLPTPTIGKILFAIGCLNGSQLFYFAKLNSRWGTKNLFMVGVVASLPAIALFPVINNLARRFEYSFAVWLALGMQLLIFSFLNICYGTIFIFITAASPTRSAVGTTNGFSQITVSVMRAIGPSVINSLFSLSIEKGYFGGYLVYLVLLLVAFFSLYIGLLLPKALLYRKQY